jgi:hypothetical protein
MFRTDSLAGWRNPYPAFFLNFLHNFHGLHPDKSPKETHHMEEVKEAPTNIEGQKYELTDETKIIDGNTLHRIRALRDIPCHLVQAGDLGGFVEKWHNLSHEGNAWVFNDAAVYGNGRVDGDAKVFDYARVSDLALIYGDAQVSNYAQIYGHAVLYGRACVLGRACVRDHAKVYGGAIVCDDAQVYDYAMLCGPVQISGQTHFSGYDIVSIQPVEIRGLKLEVFISDHQMRIGCYTLYMDAP